MLEPWSLSQKKLKKKLQCIFIKKKLLEKQNILVSSELEKKNALKT